MPNNAAIKTIDKIDFIRFIVLPPVLIHQSFLNACSRGFVVVCDCFLAIQAKHRLSAIVWAVNSGLLIHLVGRWV